MAQTIFLTTELGEFLIAEDGSFIILDVELYPLSIILSESTEYNIGLSGLTEYNISLSESTEYDIVLSKSGGGE